MEREGRVLQTLAFSVCRWDAKARRGQFKKAQDLREVAKTIPAARLFVETDCPFLAPVPKRGRRNEPSYVNHTAEKIAEVQGLSIEDVRRTTELNFFELFGIGTNAKTGTISYKIRNCL